MPMDKWDKAVSEDDLEGRICYGGPDLSSTTDITAFVMMFPPEDEGDKYIILPYFWIPEDNLSLCVRRDHVPYDVWARQGYLQTTEGNVVHYGYIEKFIESMGNSSTSGKLPSIAGALCRWCRTLRVWLRGRSFRTELQ